jgi:CRP-like cAMP-binding protein
VQVLAPGRVLFNEGAPPLSVHCIRSGLVKITKVGSGGEEQILRILGPGEVVGYRAVLAREPYAATAQAVEETWVCTIPATTLDDLLRSSPQMAVDLLAKVARELRISEEVLIGIHHKTVRRRLAGALLLLASPSTEATQAAGEAVVRLSRKDLGHLVGASPETISRTLRGLVQGGMVTTTRTEIHIADPKRLQSLAGMA